MTIEVGSGGGGLPQLAPDLTYPSSRFQSDGTFVQIEAINPSGSLTTALSLTGGKFAISYLRFSSIPISEPLTIKLTVDGVVIWNDTYTNQTGDGLLLLGTRGGSDMGPDETIQCDDAFLLEIQTDTDTDVDLDYVARPIL